MKEKILQHLKENKFNIQNAKACIWLIDMVFPIYAKSGSFHGVDYGPLFAYMDFRIKSPFSQIINQEKMDKVAKKIYFEYLKDNKSLDKKIKIHTSMTKKVDLLWREYPKKTTKKEIIDFYDSFVKLSREWWYFGILGEDKGSIIEMMIVPYFEKKLNISKNKATEIVGVLSHPEEQMVFNLERRDFINICLYVSNKEKLKNFLKEENFKSLLLDNHLKEMINDYLKNYFWMKTDFYKAVKITPEMLLKDIAKELKKSGLKKELENIDKNFKAIMKKKRELLKKLELTEEDRENIYFAERTIYWVDQRKLGMMKQFYYLFSLIQDIADRYGFKYDYLSLYTVDELRNFLHSGEKVDDKTISLRRKGCFMVFENNKPVQFFYGETAKKMINLAAEVETNKIKGVVASIGKKKKFTGVVRIIKDPFKEAFNQGEILVVSMTRVEFVPLMRKAKAIITDEGGLACHAAIVSRELGVPCIIGTKIATKVLKDGDLVEINADKGTVKIIKKK